MDGKSGNPGTPSEGICVSALLVLTSIDISFIELLYRLGQSLWSGGMTKDVLMSVVTGDGPTVRLDVTCASSSSREALLPTLITPEL